MDVLEAIKQLKEAQNLVLQDYAARNSSAAINQLANRGSFTATLNARSPALENERVMISAPCLFFRAFGMHTAATDTYIFCYDSDIAPPDLGSEIPFHVEYAFAGRNWFIDFQQTPWRCQRGLYICASSTLLGAAGNSFQKTVLTTNKTMFHAQFLNDSPA